MTFEEYEALWSCIPALNTLSRQLTYHGIYSITCHTVCRGIIDNTKPLEAYKNMPSDVYASIETVYSEAAPVMLHYKLGLLEIQELPF